MLTIILAFLLVEGFVSMLMKMQYLRSTIKRGMPVVTEELISQS